MALPHTKVTREQWIGAAVDALAEEAIDQLSVLGLSKRLGVSRSSFYWYFESPAELRKELLAVWERNTSSIVERAGREADTIVGACLDVFECWANPTLYQPAVDLSVRDWARRDHAIADRVYAADVERLDAIAMMFARHGFDPVEAMVRARLLYHSQVGYYALGTDEPMVDRLAFAPDYLFALTGTTPGEAEFREFRNRIQRESSE